MSDIASEFAALVPILGATWRTDPNELDLPYLALGSLINRMVSLDIQRPGIDWSPIFTDIERRLFVADRDMRELLIVGFLEGLQNVAGNRGQDPARWEGLLGPASREAWTTLNDMWARKISARKWITFVNDGTRPRDVADSPFSIRNSRWRTWLRVHVPNLLCYRFGRLLAPAQDCGDHEWHNQGSGRDACYHCQVTRETPLDAPWYVGPGSRDIHAR